MDMREYIIQSGDTFFQLAKQWGGTCDDWVRANPHLNPQALQVGQKVVLPPLGKGSDQYVEISPSQDREFSGEHLDEIEMELAGVQFKLRRVGENRIPHEIHVLLPRAEIHKIQPQGENGPTELKIMLSNVDIVHSPRLTSEGGAKIEGGKKETLYFPAGTQR
ncbi:MAG: LysM peptidoglycan-binding domain-containing protein [Desulfitobacteriaceae bacterium]